MKRIGIAFILALVVIGVAWVAADAAGFRGPDGPQRESMKAPEGGDIDRPLMDSEEFQAEKERHQKAMQEIMAEGKPLRVELRKEILALWKKYFPDLDAPKFLEEDCDKAPGEMKKGEKPSEEEMKKMREEMKAKGEKFRKIDKDKMKAFMEEAKKLTDAFAEKNKDALVKIAGKAFDEKILHQENVIKIAKSLRAQIIEAHYKRVLMPHMFRGGMGHGQGGPQGPKGPQQCPRGGECPRDKN